VVSVDPSNAERLRSLADEHGVPLTFLGRTKDDSMRFRGLFEFDPDEARETYETAISKLLGA
jgi:hypothetical protein